MYKSGDIVKVFFPFSDKKEGKTRPALIISKESINNPSCIVLQITGQIHGGDTHYEIKPSMIKNCKLEKISYVNFHHVTVIRAIFIKQKLGELKAKQLREVVSKFKALIYP